MSDSNKQAGGGETDTETIPPPSDHILPAKSEDKLEIEKEEKEREAEEKAKIEGKDGDDKDDDETDNGENKGEREGERKKFKIRTPKFLRSISKERKKVSNLQEFGARSTICCTIYPWHVGVRDVNHGRKA